MPSIVDKLRGAADQLGLSTDHQGVIAQWFEQLRANAGDAPLTTAVAVDSDFDELVCFVGGATAVAEPLVRDVMDATGAAASERTLLARTRKALGPAQLGTWLAAGAAGFDAGWWFEQTRPTREVRTIVPASAAAGLVWDWADDVGTAACCGLRRAINADTPFTEVALPLPADKRSDAIEQASAILGMDSFGADVLACVQDIERLALSVRLLEEGITRLALVVTDPPTGLSFADAGRLDEARLSKFANAVGGRRRRVEIARTNRGLQVETRFQLGA